MAKRTINSRQGVSGVAFVGILCGATVTGGQMARKTAGVEEFDFLRVQTRNVIADQPHDETAVHKPKPKVLDIIKQSIDEIIQKTRKSTRDKSKEQAEEAILLTSLTSAKMQDTESHVETNEAVNIMSSGVEEPETKLEIFTEHVHKASKTVPVPHPVSGGESLVVGNHSTFKGLHTIVGIPGWGNKESEECICESWAHALHSMLLFLYIDF